MPTNSNNPFPAYTMSSAHHNPEDWAVLQSILNDEEGDDTNNNSNTVTVLSDDSLDGDEWMPRSVRQQRRRQLNNSRAMLERNSSNGDGAHTEYHQYQQQKSDGSTDDDDNDQMVLVPTDSKASTEPSSDYNKIDGDVIYTTSNDTDSGDVGKKYLATAIMQELNNTNNNNNASNAEPDRTVEENEKTRRGLNQAQALERKLLRSGRRELVSPLMVKRRLKAKIELTARDVRSQPSVTTTTKANHHQRHPSKSASKSLAPSSTSRFQFSGIVDDKIMASVSASLQKHSNISGAQGSKILCGLPTCMACNTKFIAIGTQQGIILVYDLFEVLRQRLGTGLFDDNHDLAEAGATTSIDISSNGEAVIAGYASGIVVLWDTIRGTILRTVSDAHPSPITSVRFMSNHQLSSVTVDAGGLVNRLSFSKNMLWSNYSVETECLLDGTAGQILAMDILSPYNTVKQSVRPLGYGRVFRSLTLIALSSERSSFVVAVEPKINVLHRWSRPQDDKTREFDIDQELSSDHIKGNRNGNQEFLPCLSWGWGLIAGGGNVAMPVLARAWGCCLQLLMSTFPSLEDSTTGQTASLNIGEEPVIHWPAFGVHQEVDACTPILALEWLNERTLVYLTVDRELNMIDTVMMTLLERLDFSPIKMVYAEFELSRAAGSKEAGQSAACSVFQNSTCCSDERLMIVCRNELRCISVVGARDRISALEADGEWLEALAFALDHYENTVVSQEDRKRLPEGKTDISKHPEFSVATGEDDEWIAKLLIRYLNLAVDNAPEASTATSPYSPTGRIDLAQSHFQMLAGVCVDFCVVTRRLDLLFGSIFRRFESAGYIPVFLDVLEPYVLNDKLSYIAPEVMSHFVQHCKATNGVTTVERCLLHMDCTIMDFDSILLLLRNNDMYSALFYVFNQGLNDYVTPLEIILERVFSDADTGGVSIRKQKNDSVRSSFLSFGYKTILYLQACFGGKSFPREEVIQSESRIQTMRFDLIQFLMQKTYKPSSHVKKSMKLLPEVGYRSYSYPYARVLLLVDPRGMLDTIATALDSSASTSFHQTAVESERPDDWIQQDTKEHLDRQEVSKKLSSILLRNSSSSRGNSIQSRSAENAFLDFAAKYIMDGVVRLDKTVTLMVFVRVTKQYTSSETAEQRLTFQRQVMSLLSALPRESYDPDQVLNVLQKGNMHRAALLLHQQVASSWHSSGFNDFELRERHFMDAIDCFIGDDDALFRLNVFDYVKKEISGTGVEVGSSKSLRDSLFTKLIDLVRLDALMTTRLVAELLVDDVDRVISELEKGENGTELYSFLSAIVSGDLIETDPVAGSVLNLSMEHHQKYLSIMARLHPESVYEYLSTHNNYRAEDCLRLCQRHDIADASAYLLERLGNVSNALQLILQTLETRLMSLKRTVRGMGVDSKQNASRFVIYTGKSTDREQLSKKEKQEIEGVKRILVVSLDICERNSETFTAGDRDSSKYAHGELWFNVVDRLINAKGFLRLSKERPKHASIMAGVLSDLLRQTMQRMVSNVPLSDLVRKVTSDHSGSSIGELREMVESLLATYGFERKVFMGATSAFHHDIQCMGSEKLKLKQSGFPVHKMLGVSLRKEITDACADRQQVAANLHKDSVLRVGKRGNALDAGGKRTSSSTAAMGLVNSMEKLRSRRVSIVGRQEITASTTSLSFMTVEEQMYKNNEIDSSSYGSACVGVLGDAQHRGRLISFE